jgi:hypothetical protein
MEIYYWMRRKLKSFLGTNSFSRLPKLYRIVLFVIYSIMIVRVVAWLVGYH